MSERDEETQHRPTPAKRGRRGAVPRVAGELVRKPTGRPRGRPTKGLLKVACPTCLAAINAMCVTATGKKLAAGHEKRRELAGLDPREKWKPADVQKDGES